MVCTLDKNIEHFPLGSSACVRMYVRGLEWMAWTLFFGKRYAIPCTEIYVKYCEVCRNTAKDGERRRKTATTRERRRKHGTDSENTGQTAKTRAGGRAGGRRKQGFYEIVVRKFVFVDIAWSFPHKGDVSGLSGDDLWMRRTFGRASHQR